MKPAYHIPLTARQLRSIGVLCATQAQIEWSMQITVMRLLGIALPTALRIMGSTSIATNSEIWIQTVREKHPSDVARKWAEIANANIAEMAQGRNDFIHSLYGVDLRGVIPGDNLPPVFMVKPSLASRVRHYPSGAIRLRSHAAASLEKLPSLCASAAKLSVIMAFVESSANEEDKDSAAALRRRLGPLPLPQSPKTQAGRAKGPPRQPQASPR